MFGSIFFFFFFFFLHVEEHVQVVFVQFSFRMLQVLDSFDLMEFPVKGACVESERLSYRCKL